MSSSRVTSPANYQTNVGHPVLQAYKAVSNRLEQEHHKVHHNNSKIEELKKKVGCLEVLTRNSVHQSNYYQRRLEKLENTQKYATELLKMKYDSFVQLEKDKGQRYKQCMTQRANMQSSRKAAHSFHQLTKSYKFRKIRADQDRVAQELRKSASVNQQRVRQQTQQIRQQEERLKDRKKKYQAFKLERAALNYEEKLAAQYQAYKRKISYLNQLQKKAGRAEEVFRKTQRLDKEAAKIESMYLTDLV